MKSRFTKRPCVTLLGFLIVGLFLPFDIIAQKAKPRDLRENLKLIETFDFTHDERYQLTFTKKSELFLTTRNRLTKKWSYRKGNVKKDFTPCGDNKSSQMSLYNIGTDFNYDANLFSFACEDFSVEIWDLDNAKRVSRFQVQKDKESSKLHPYLSYDGKRVLLKFTGLGEFAELWDAVNGKKIATLTSEATKCSCNRTVYYANGFSPDGRTAVVSFGGMTFLWDAETGKLLNRLVDEEGSLYGHNIMTHGYGVEELLFNHNGKIVITASADGATSWNAETGELMQRFRQDPPRSTYSLALSPDEKILATGGYSRNIRLWDFKIGKLLWKSPDIGKTVRELSFSPDGGKILSRTNSKLSIWEVATGKQLEQISVTETEFPGFSPDWRYVTMFDKKSNSMALYEYLGK